MPQRSRADPLLAERITDHQGVVADDVHQARNAARELPDLFLGLAREHLGVGTPGCLEAKLDVLAELVAGERCQPAADGDPLAQLAQLRAGQLLFGAAGREDDPQIFPLAVSRRESGRRF
jgi:hypothetical protein